MKIGDYFREKREQKGLSLRNIALKANITSAYLSQFETNLVKNPPSEEVLVNLSNALNFSKEELEDFLRMAALERTPDMIKQELEQLIKAAKRESAIEALPNQVDMIKMPVYSGVRAGENGVICYGEIIGYEFFPHMKNAENKFNIKVYGDSMEPMIPQNATITINKQQDLDNGQIGVFVINGDEGIVKKFYREDEFIRLVSLNPSYKDIIILPEKEFYIAGRVVNVSYSL